jgi:hypothetical protein
MTDADTHGHIVSEPDAATPDRWLAAGLLAAIVAGALLAVVVVWLTRGLSAVPL